MPTLKPVAIPSPPPVIAEEPIVIDGPLEAPKAASVLPLPTIAAANAPRTAAPDPEEPIDLDAPIAIPEVEPPTPKPASSSSPTAAPPIDGSSEMLPPGDSAVELVIDRPSAAPAATAAEPAPPFAPKPFSPALALAAAVAIGAVSLAIGYRLLHGTAPSQPAAPETPTSKPEQPFAAPNASSEASLSAPPSPATASAPPARATFTAEPVAIAGAAPPPAPESEHPGSAPNAGSVKDETSVTAEPAEVKWSFRGTAFDLMTGAPVFAAKIILVNAKGETVGQAETGTKGQYELSVPAGDGYSVKILHTDYLAHCIDQGENTLALRQATPEDRQVLMHATNNRLWMGKPKGVVVHDLALIPVNAANE